MRRAIVLATVWCLACGASTPRPRARAAERASCVSDASVRVVAGLRRPFTVQAFFTPGPPKLDAFARRLEAFMRALEKRSHGKLHFEMVWVTRDDQAALATKLGLQKLQLEEKDAAVLPNAFSGLAFSYGGKSDVIPVLSPDNQTGLEYWIANKIRDVSNSADERKIRIGVTIGHGELSLAEANLVAAKMGKPTMKEVFRRNFPYYELVDVDLGGPIDTSLRGLLVTQPAVDIPDDDLRRIDDFVMTGKPLVVLASAVNLKKGDASMSAVLSLHGLDRLLAGYGIEMHRDVVLDFGGAYRIPVETQEGRVDLRVPQLLSITDSDQAIDTAFPPLFRMMSIVVPFASSITLHPERQPGAKMHVVARSSDHSIVATTSPIDLQPLQAWRPRGTWERYDVGAVVDGQLTSAFSRARSTGPARVFVLSSSQMSANPFARAGNGPDLGVAGAGGDERLLMLAGPYSDLQHGVAPLLTSILFLMNTFEWMANEPELNALASSELRCR
jgi:hypothetical protein